MSTSEGRRNITVCTACRDASSRIDGFRRQIDELDWPREDVRVAVCEGDSVDGTWNQLLDWVAEDKRVRLVNLDTGEPRFGSVVSEARFRNLARVFNRALDQVDLTWTDWVLFLPFDITVQPDLVKRLVAHDVDLVSPMTWKNGAFYDVWACVQDEGVQWVNFPKHWADRHWGGRLLPMFTIGGTILIRAKVLKDGVRYTEAEVDRGLSKWAKRLGYKCWLDTGTHVIHP